MNEKILIIAGVLILLITSCKGKTQVENEQIIEKSISQMKVEIDSLQNSKYHSIENSDTEKVTLGERLKSKISGDSPGDSIVGIWEVKNDYYMAVYEIVKFEDQYFGKIRYYNDGETEIEAQNSKEDYFLDGVFYKDGKYSNGKMYMPDGKNYQCKFTLEGDELSVQMTIEGQPYTEIWKRKKYENKK